MGYVKDKACSTAKVEPLHYEELKEQYILDTKVVVEMEDVPLDLIMNWDHTVVPGCPWTIEEKGAKSVDCVRLDDKRQITTVICATISGIFFCHFRSFMKAKEQQVCQGIPSLKNGM